MKLLKLKVGEIYKDGKSIPVYRDFWERESKDGKTKYFESRDVIFVSEVEEKPKEEAVKSEL